MRKSTGVPPLNFSFSRGDKSRIPQEVMREASDLKPHAQGCRPSPGRKIEIRRLVSEDCYLCQWSPNMMRKASLAQGCVAGP